MSETEEAQEANKSVLEQMKDFLDRKDAAKKDLKDYKKANPKPKQTEQDPEEETKQAPQKAEQESHKYDEPKTYLQEFEDKLVKDFNLTVKIDSYGWHQLFFQTFKVFELVPRKGFRFGVYREDPAQDNKWKCFRVEKDEDETQHYEFAKEFCKINSE